MSSSKKELYSKREKRVNDAIQLKVPDRVPVSALFGFFPVKYAGITMEEAMYNETKMVKAWTDTINDFQPDMYDNPYGTRFLGAILETLDYKALKWPGKGLGKMSSYQYIEDEYMKPHEYEAFLFDPSDYLIRTHWPRVFGALEPFGKLPPLHIISYYLGILDFGAFDDPNILKALEAIQKAAQEIKRLISGAAAFADQMKALGFPPTYGAISQAPFDTLSDFFRGTKGAMLDMFRNPEKIQEITERILPMMLQAGLKAKERGIPRVFIPLHKGLDGFMSHDQFKTLFWPGLKKLMLGLIEEGLIPSLFWEGDCTSRLEIIGDIPRGKAVYHFEGTDIFRAKEVLGDNVCIRGNVPLSIMCTGTPDDVKEYCKKLIDIVGKGGGFIMDSGCPLDDAKTENVRAMIDFTKAYGVYS